MHPVAGVGPVAVVPPSGLWGAWTFDPLVVAGLGVAAALYARGLAKLRHRLVRPRQAVSFFAGILVYRLLVRRLPRGAAGGVQSLLLLFGVWLLVASHGTLRRRASSVRLRSVENLELEQSLPGRLLGYGTLVAGPLEIDHVAEPRNVYRLVERLAG